MAITIDISPNSGDSHQSSPYWIAYIIPFLFKGTYNYDIANPGSILAADQDPVKEGAHIIIDDDCISWNLSTSKGAHTASLALTLAPNQNYLSKLNAQDWILFWSFDNKTDYENVLNRLKNKDFSSKPALNHKSFGLKFIGRITTISNSISVANNGMKTFSYNLAAHAFSELDSLIYFDPIIHQNLSNTAFYWSDFTNQAALKKKANSLMPTQFTIPALLIMLLGEGFTNKAKTGTQSNNASVSNNPGLSQTPNEKFLIPKSIAEILQKTDVPPNWMAQEEMKQSVLNTIEKDVAKAGISLAPDDPMYASLNPSLPPAKTYADLLEVFVGVHDYRKNYIPDWDNTKSVFQGTGFFIRESPSPLNDPMLVAPINYSMVSLWSVLKGYLNSPINEMYTCMRLGVGDNIYPTLMVRRIPFSSDSMSAYSAYAQAQTSQAVAQAVSTPPAPRNQIKAKQAPSTSAVGTTAIQTASAFDDNFEITQFLDVPRWRIDDGLIMSIAFTKSTTARTNYVMMQPSRPGITDSLIRNNLSPIVDSADIKRNGLHGIVQSIQSTFTGNNVTIVNNRSSFYNKFWMDINANNHLKLTGNVICAGIQAPICEGDNCVIGNYLFHIEQITHSGSVAANGVKTSATNMQLTNGILLKESDDTKVHCYYIENETPAQDQGLSKKDEDPAISGSK